MTSKIKDSSAWTAAVIDFFLKTVKFMNSEIWGINNMNIINIR